MNACREGVADVAALGFNSIFLDSKLWDDFWEFYETGSRSQYVAGQEVIIEAARSHGLGVSFLAFYNVGDNLYPEIRDSLPRILDRPVGPDGRPFLGYRHWSTAQRDEFIRHVRELHESLAAGAVAVAVDQDGETRRPFYFYHSPAFIPSFDEDGRTHYLGWLQERYSLDDLNRRYGTRHFAFDDLTFADFWIGRDPYDVPSSHAYELASARSIDDVNVELRMWADNQTYRRDVLNRSVARLAADVRQYDPSFYLYSCLSQWKYLMTEWIHLYSRGLDLWSMGKILDSPSFYTLPADAYSEPNAHVVPFEMAMSRSASTSGGFLGGLFVGRYVHNDVYAHCTPAECIASALGAGALGLYFYGYNGLDDGGNFGKWGGRERASLTSGLDWFTSVLSLAGARQSDRDAAILFPDASFMLSNPETDPVRYAALRNDALGWYQHLADHGINADILHPRQAADGGLDGYGLFVLPSDPYYEYAPVTGLADATAAFVRAGGCLLHSASSAAGLLAGIDSAPHTEDSMDWEERLVDNSPCFRWYPQGEVEARFMSSGRPAIVRQKRGSGEAVSFGIDVGFAYISRSQKPVPRRYGPDNHYPMTMARRTPVDKVLEEHGFSRGRLRGVERVRFAEGTLWINHTSYPVNIGRAGSDEVIATCEPGPDGRLAGHQAAFVRTTKDATGDSSKEHR
jgi:hypothetical protein